MGKEASTFFIMGLVGLAVAYVYISSLGGFKTTSHSTAAVSQPPAATDYRTLARQDATNARINPDLFVRQIAEESGFNPNAVSAEGAIGIAQFMPQTANGLGINPWDPQQSLQGAALLMSRYIAKYGDYRHALAAYNCGSGCLENAMRRCLYFYWCVPPATQRYIDAVMG